MQYQPQLRSEHAGSPERDQVYSRPQRCTVHLVSRVGKRPLSARTGAGGWVNNMRELMLA